MCGSVDDSPTIISVKKIPIDSTCAEFWKVWFIAPPAPRCSGGSEFMIAARLGDANIPIEIPVSSSAAANIGYSKSVGSRSSIRKLQAAPTSRPTRTRARRAIRRYPDVGPASSIPTVSGSM